MQAFDTLLGCDLKSLRHKYILTNSLPLSAKLLERHTYFGAQPQSVQSLARLLDEQTQISGTPKQAMKLTPEEREFFGESLRDKLAADNYFKEAFKLPGLRAKVFNCIDELRLAGYTAQTLSPEGVENTKKIESLKEIFSLYEKHLSDRKVRDYPLILKDVIDLLQKGNYDEHLSNVDIVAPFPLDLRGMETTFLEVLQEKAKYFSPKNSTQAFLVETPPASQNLKAFKKSIQAYLTRVPLENGAKHSPPDTSLKVQACLTVEESLSEFFCWLSERGGNIGEAALVTPDYDSYAGAIYRFCQKHGIRLNLSNGLLASEFAFFAEDMAALEISLMLHKRKGTAREFLTDAQNYFRRRRCPGEFEEAYETFQTQALSFIHNYLTAQKEFPAVTVSESHSWDLLREHLLSVRIPLSALELDRQGLFFGRPQDIIGCQVAHLGIVGLQDHNYPPKVVPDPILTDDERSALNERIEQGALHHELRLANPTELQKDLLEKISLSVERSLFLAFESHDLSSGGRSLPSSFLNRVLSAFGLEMSAEALYDVAGKIPESFFPRTSTTNLLVGYDEHLASLGQVGQRFSGWSALLGRRRSRERSQEDGATLPKAHAPLLQAEYSPSTIADFFSCPYRFYLKKVAGVKEIDTQRHDELQWLDRLERGKFIHSVFEHWVKTFLEGEQSAPAWARFLRETAGGLIETVLLKASAQFEAKKKGIPQVVIDAELAEIREIALEFIQREIKDVEATGFYPIRAEEEFKNLAYSWTPAGSKDPISLIFKGFIDRIDTDGKGAYRVVDYKTGSNPFKDAANLFRDKKDYVHFQHAIYALWVRSQPELKVTQLIAGYYFTSDAAEWERVEAPFENFAEHFSRTMSVFHAALKAGDFPKNAQACKYCDYRLVCGGIQDRRKNFAAESSTLEQIELSLVPEEVQ